MSTSADAKIKEIEQGIEPEYFTVITDNDEATRIFANLCMDAQNEILFLLPNDKALTRMDRLGILDYLTNKRSIEKKEDMIQVKIICPISDANLNIVNRVMQNTSTSNNIRIVNGNNNSFGIVIVDNKKFLKAELREPEAEQFSEAIGLSFCSNSKPSVYSVT